MRLINFTFAFLMAVATASLEFLMGTSSNITNSLYKRDESHSELFSSFSSILSNQHVSQEEKDKWAENLSLNGGLAGTRHDTNSSLAKHGWGFEDWFRFGARMVGYTGATFSGVIPFCRSFVQGDNFFTETWQCVILAISTITIVESVSGSVANEIISVWGIENRGAQNGIGPIKRDIIVETYGIDEYSYRPWYNLSGLTEHYNSIGLSIGFLTTEMVVLKGNDLFTGDLNYTLSLGSQPVANLAHANNVTTISINDFAHMQPSVMKRDIVGENEYNNVYFTQGGIKLQSCKYDGYSEQLTAPKDIEMVYNAVNSIPGFWYYYEQQISHIIAGDMNTWVDIPEGYLQFDAESFGFNGFLEPWQVCKSDHDEL